MRADSTGPWRLIEFSFVSQPFLTISSYLLQNTNVAMAFAMLYVIGVEQVKMKIKERFQALIPWLANIIV